MEKLAKAMQELTKFQFDSQIGHNETSISLTSNMNRLERRMDAIA